MSTSFLHTRIFVKPPGGAMVASDLKIDLPTRFLGFPGKPLAADHPPVYQAMVHFPGVIPDGGFSARQYSNLEALISVLTSAKQFCKDFTKAGGVLYPATPGNEDVPLLDEALSIKDFFSL